MISQISFPKTLSFSPVREAGLGFFPAPQDKKAGTPVPPAPENNPFLKFLHDRWVESYLENYNDLKKKNPQLTGKERREKALSKCAATREAITTFVREEFKNRRIGELQHVELNFFLSDTGLGPFIVTVNDIDTSVKDQRIHNPVQPSQSEKISMTELATAIGKKIISAGAIPVSPSTIKAHREEGIFLSYFIEKGWMKSK